MDEANEQSQSGNCDDRLITTKYTSSLPFESLMLYKLYCIDASKIKEEQVFERQREQLGSPRYDFTCERSAFIISRRQTARQRSGQAKTHPRASQSNGTGSTMLPTPRPHHKRPSPQGPPSPHPPRPATPHGLNGCDGTGPGGPRRDACGIR